MRSQRICLMLASCLVATQSLVGLVPAAIVTLEDVGAGLGPNSFYNGGPTNNSDGWTSGGVQFDNRFTDFGGGLTLWEGWAYSNVQDINTPGFGNQYAAYSESGIASGFGAGNSRTYALAYPGSQPGINGSVLNFATTAVANSVDITNTTYAVRAFRDGLSGSAKFLDGDFFRLLITGFDASNASGNQTGSVAIDLANYGGAGTADDFYVRDWTNINLTALGQVRSLKFSLDSNVIDTYSSPPPLPPQVYLNTPAYLALDNLSFTAVPEPSSLVLAGWVGILLGVQRRRKRNLVESLEK